MAQKSIEERITDARNAAELALLKRIKAEADTTTDGENLANMAGAYMRFAEAVDKMDGPLVLACPCYPDTETDDTAEGETTG